MYHLCKVGILSKLCEHAKEFKDKIKAKHEEYGEQVTEFNEHMANFGLSFGTVEEYNFRKAQYLKNDKIIKEVNAENLSYQLGHNQFSTWTDDEYQRLLGYKPDNSEMVEEVPTNYDLNL